MSSKSNTLYKILVIITLALPVPIYLFLNAALFKMVPDYTINSKIETIEVISVDDKWFVYSIDQNASYDGLVVYYPLDDRYGIYINDKNIIKIDGNFFTYSKNESSGLFEWKDVKKIEIQKTLSYKLPISFLISLIGVCIIAAIIVGKMKVFNKYPRLSALGALLTGTIILAAINLIIDSLLGVFFVATISWAIYCIEHYVHTGKINKSEAEDKISKLERALREELK